MRYYFSERACRPIRNGLAREACQSKVSSDPYIVKIDFVSRIVHAFTCAGVQYLHFSSHAGLGKVSSWSACSNCTLTTRHCDVTVYKKGGYLDVVNACANVSI